IDAGEKIEAGEWMPDEYRLAAMKFIEMHANSEVMGALPEREWIPRAPTLKRKLSLTAKVQDEVGHGQILYRVAEDLGKSREQMVAGHHALLRAAVEPGQGRPALLADQDPVERGPAQRVLLDVRAEAVGRRDHPAGPRAEVERGEGRVGVGRARMGRLGRVLAGGAGRRAHDPHPAGLPQGHVG